MGALATTARPTDRYLTKGYYAVRRHIPAVKTTAIGAHLETEPLRFSMQSRIVALLTERMKLMTTHVSPRFSAQSFYLADGTIRYYATLDWGGPAHDVLAAWLSSTPALHILAVETRLLPSLRNVVDLGGGRTGLIVSWNGGDSGGLQLVEYRDSMSLQQMPHLYEISAGE